ncbi:arsenosugar biosynthesis radical SAM (seleno)protein ArsS [candidate division CSSED10-310 bacterium]|uniref:Arsenosugar biosynthesis radical SAM (Seleno)protein ArsS n=1 Tax=candidate division CSSED10-310 bacterium TaxID=2855610 RepID=A0ABV6Z5V9_UNCC1
MSIQEKDRATNSYNFKEMLEKNNVNLRPQSLSILQVNLTYMCNQACRHCHVNASPQRQEVMTLATVDACLDILEQHHRIDTLDLTGGAPELNPHFEYFVIEATKLGKHVIVRHNLTVTFDGHPRTGQSKEYLPEFFASQKCELVCSLPYYQPYFTNKQRGNGIFEKSIKSLKILNDHGFGKAGSGLILNLVYNPVGAFLPGCQNMLEADFKKELSASYGAVFNSLYTITNMPILRFKEQLKRLGKLDSYLEKLVTSFNPSAAEAVMCLNQVNVGYDGRLYDCDFNQMLGMQIVAADPLTVHNFDYDLLLNREILLAPHCFGCTAGAGSSCGGAIAEN